MSTDPGAGRLGPANSPRRNLVALLLAGPWLVLVLVRVCSLDTLWLPIVLVAFAPLALLTIVLPALAAGLLRAWWAAGVVLVAALTLAVAVLPRELSRPQPAADGLPLKLLSANVFGEAASADGLLAAIRASDPDIIALQEAGPRTIADLRAGGVLRTLPYISGDPQHGTLGYVTLSRHRLTPVAGSALAGGRWPELRVAGTPLILRNIHPDPPLTPAAAGPWRATLAALPGPAGQLRVIAGDFNATLDHRAFRALLARGYRDAGAARGDGLDWTWHDGPLRRLVIDHVLVAPPVRVDGYRVIGLPGSDHRAVAVSITLPR
jgi:endonuclease/exonuclease/phosphatase (EEP) superfamily protein YafD